MWKDLANFAEEVVFVTSRVGPTNLRLALLPQGETGQQGLPRIPRDSQMDYYILCSEAALLCSQTGNSDLGLKIWVDDSFHRDLDLLWRWPLRRALVDDRCSPPRKQAAHGPVQQSNVFRESLYAVPPI